MKNYYLVLFAICIAHFSHSQIVNIPDANFKTALINHVPIIDSNSDGEIQESEAAIVTVLNVENSNITSLSGIESFFALETFACANNNIISLDISQNLSLTLFECSNNQLSNLNVSNNGNLSALFCIDNQLSTLDISYNTNLIYLFCDNNQLTNLDVSNNASIQTIQCDVNQLTSIDLSNNPNINSLSCSSNPLLTSINLKNGANLFDGGYLEFNNCLSLSYICADDYELQLVQTKIDTYGYTNCTVNTYCSFTPGATFYEVSGQARLDANTNGCDVGDSNYPNLQYNINDGVTAGAFIGNASGNYNIPIQAGTYTITPQVENATYFSVSPTSIVVNFPADGSPYAQDFCVTPNGTFNDLEMVLLPLTGARPGFDANYQLFYKNKGTTILSGTLNFSFNDDVLDLVSATPSADTQSTGLLSWNYSNLQPFESGVINITLNINTPTDPSFPVNGGDILDITATINPVAGDETPLDNVTELHQTVVNSYDPNDKTCLEGKTIEPSEVGEYLHYVIRFENTGSANAINIVVKDVIDTSMYDVSTLIPLHGSHEYITRIKNTNEVEFIFENINLPFDDANNDGFLAFKIKTLPTLVENDTFENEAEIYFDFNFPIITNKEITTVVNPLGVSEYILDSSLKIYPNPTKDFIKISGNNNIESIALYDINGRLLQEVKVLGNQLEKELSLQQLTSGIYLIKVTSSKGVLLDKLIKE